MGKQTKSLKTIFILDIQKSILWLIALICGLLIVCDEKNLLNIYLPDNSDSPVYKYMNAAITGGIMLLCLLVLIVYCLISFFKSLFRRSNRYGIINLILVCVMLAILICCFVALAVEASRFVSDLTSYINKSHSSESRDEIEQKINDLLKQCRNVFLAPAILSIVGLLTTIGSATLCFLSARSK